MNEETLFDLILNAPESERAAILDHACEGQPELRLRVEALLKADAVPAKYLAQPPVLDATTGFDVTTSFATGDVAGAVIAGRYKLLEEIGEGGMGTVWKAQQSEPVKRLVAIKLIKAGMDSKAVLARFEAERQALAMMDHPNIAKVLDGGLTEDRRPYFVMELVKGTPITKFCDDRKLSLKERLELFVPVCQAIQHAHQKGVIHRDIKPSNVLITLYDDKPVPKVIDFGIAKATGAQLTEQTLNTGFGNIVGTPEYMSPEQASLNNLDIDTRSDVYALGVLMYELLTGTTPVDRKSLGKAAILEILRIVREVEAPRPSTKLSTSEALASIAANRHTEPAKLPNLMKGELDWIVMKALEKDRTRRYETANGFAQDIQRFLSDGVVEARPASAVYRMKKWIRRNPLPVAVAASLFLAITAGVISTEIQRSRAEQETNAKLAAFEKLKEEQEKTKAALAVAKVNEEKARLELENTAAMKQFLVDDIISQAGIGIGSKSDTNIMLRTALELASQKIPERFTDRPIIAASLHKSLGTAFLSLGLSREALRQYEASHRICYSMLVNNNSHGEDIRENDFMMLTAMIPRLLTMLNEHNKAMTFILDLEKNLKNMKLDNKRREQMAEFVTSTRVFLEEGGADFLPNQVPENEKQSRQRAQSNQGSDSFSSKMWEATSLITKGQFREASHILAWLSESKRNNGDEIAHAVLLYTLGHCYRKIGNYDESLVILLRGKNELLKYVGDKHPVYSACLLELGHVYMATKKFENAKEVLQNAMTLYEQQFPGLPQYLEVQSLFGSLCAYQGNVQEAERLLVDSITQLKKSKKKLWNFDQNLSSLLPDAIRRLIDFYTQTGNTSEAAKWQKELDTLKATEKEAKP